jgi:hypothetical protein
MCEAYCQPVWAVTTYFNPMRYRRRRENYHVFRAALEIPLLAVELGFGEFYELGSGAADILIQCRSRDILWQKERLLNMAIKALPASCSKVVWLDCDVLFTREDWIDEISRTLDRSPLIQAYRRLYHLPPDRPRVGERPLNALEQPGLAAAVSGGKPAKNLLGQRTKDRSNGDVATGMAWAGRRDLLERHGFYDACIIGGGIRAMACAAYGCFDNIIATHAMNPRQQDHFLAWARPFFDSVKGEVSFIDADIHHLWHGDLSQRRLDERHQGLAAFDFDPNRDIALDPNGCWRWNSEKPAMHEYIRNYFASRNEDGVKT